MGQNETAVTNGNRIMIYGPKNDGTYVIEFRTAAARLRRYVNYLPANFPATSIVSFVRGCKAVRTTATAHQAAITSNCVAIASALAIGIKPDRSKLSAM